MQNDLWRTRPKLPCPRRRGSPLPSSSSLRSWEVEGMLSEPRSVNPASALRMELCLTRCPRRQISKPAASRPSTTAKGTATPARTDVSACKNP